jgi:hypothetical protein
VGGRGRSVGLCFGGVPRGARGCGHGRGEAILDATGSARVQPEVESGDVVGVVRGAGEGQYR